MYLSSIVREARRQVGAVSTNITDRQLTPHCHHPSMLSCPLFHLLW